MECPTCKKDFDEHTGRRPKKFCSDACKIKYFNAKKKLDKIINTPEQKEERKKVVEDLMEKGIAKTKVTDLTKTSPPKREDFEDNWAYLEAKNLWKTKI